MKRSWKLNVLTVVLLFVVGRADASEAFTLDNIYGWGADGWTLGFTFRANEEMVITRLGLFDHAQDGFVQSHQLGLWDSGGKLLASGTIGSGTTAPLTKQFRYIPVAPVTLQAGKNYVVGALYPSGNQDGIVWVGEAVNFTTAPGFTFVQPRFGWGDSLVYPSGQLSDLRPGYIGPNLATEPTVDIVAKSLTPNLVSGGVDFECRVAGSPLPQDTTAELFWAKSENLADIINASSPVFSMTIPKSTALDTPIPQYVSPTVLGLPPAGATHLLLVVDRTNVIDEADESNNVCAWKSNLSGGAWCQAYAGQWPDNNNISALNDTFQPKVEAFIAALIAAGATVQTPPESVYRPKERSYLMHHAWLLVHPESKTESWQITDPTKVEACPGVDINWNYGSDQLSRAAAAQMVGYFNIGSYAALISKHRDGLALDMAVSWTGTLSIYPKGAKQPIPITTTPCNADNFLLGSRLSGSYGVYRIFDDKVAHWSNTAPVAPEK